MKTIATMALLLGTIAVGIAPAAEAHDAHRDPHDAKAEWRTHQRHGHGHGPRGAALHARQVREVRHLAFRLERATDELRRDARRAAGRVSHREAHALRAVARLEESADRFGRHASRRGPVAVRSLRGELRGVERAFDDALGQARRSVRSHELRADFRRVRHLLDELEEVFEPGRRFAYRGHGLHVARR
jgi:hypothetical protein